MLLTIKQNIKELIIILAMMQVVILLMRMIIPRSLQRALRVLMKGLYTTVGLAYRLIKWISIKGYKVCSNYIKEQKAKQPAVPEQTAANIIPFPSRKKVAK